MVVAKNAQNSDSGFTCLGFLGCYNTNRIVCICCHIILSKIIIAIMDILKGTITATNKLADGCNKTALNSDSCCTCLGFFGSYNINRIAPICCHIIQGKITVAIMDILKGTFMATNKLANGCRKNAHNSDSGCACFGFLECHNTNRIFSICVVESI
jgi:hypothetical protein